MVDDGDVLCVEVSYIEAYDTECETGCVVGCGQLHVTGLRAGIFFTDHETTITRHGWLDLAELVQQCRHLFSSADMKTAQRLPMLMIAKADAYQEEASPPVAAAHILLIGVIPAPLPPPMTGIA